MSAFGCGTHKISVLLSIGNTNVISSIAKITIEEMKEELLRSEKWNCFITNCDVPLVY